MAEMSPLQAALIDFRRRTGVDFLDYLRGDPKALERLDRLNRKARLGMSLEQIEEEARLLEVQERELPAISGDE